MHVLSRARRLREGCDMPAQKREYLTTFMAAVVTASPSGLRVTSWRDRLLLRVGIAHILHPSHWHNDSVLHDGIANISASASSPSTFTE